MTETDYRWRWNPEKAPEGARDIAHQIEGEGAALGQVAATVDCIIDALGTGAATDKALRHVLDSLREIERRLEVLARHCVKLDRAKGEPPAV